MLRSAALLVPLLTIGCAKALPPDMLPEATLPYVTEDGWQAQVRHYPGDGPTVMLVHGMGANHYNWDYREEVSFAAYLQERGWDVWIPELRGDPGSVAPSRRARRSYTFDDHAEYDLPAAVDAVLTATGDDDLLWVGHSMGGMLLYTALSEYPDKVSAGVAVCSPARFYQLLGIHKNVAGLGWAVKGRGMLPAAFLAHLTAPLGKANPLYKRLGNRDNLDFHVANGMARHALINIPKPMAHQATQWLDEGELVRVSGEPWLRPDDTPLLVLGGAVDRIVPEYNVALACDTFTNCDYRTLGVAGGFATDYGHVDPVVGKTARDEVFPVIEAWLQEQVQAATADAPEPAE